MAPPRSAVAAKLQQEHDDLLPSEDEEDHDFQLSDGDLDDGGSDSSDSEREQGPSRKKARVEQEEVAAPALDKSAVDDLWASFNDPGATDPYAATTTMAPAASTTSTLGSPATAGANQPGSGVLDNKGKAKANLDQDDLVTIKVTYKFAGDTITQDKRVPRTSQEAINYFALHPEQSAAKASPTAVPTKPDPTTASLDALFGPDTSLPTSAPPLTSAEPDPLKPPAPTSAAAAAAPLPPAGGPRRKKAGGGLGAMAASMGVGVKPAKLNTLEKSKLDWNSYVQTQDGLQDTLQHARKDGYLEKKDFLDRVEARKEQGWESAKKKGPR
ncbi:Swc5p [Sporobolomyces koalae]|uniref:Swc5p n=1 Tax=Sporobolomyces koalae TaxID=500713 RepID=UPI003172FBBF